MTVEPVAVALEAAYASLRDSPYGFFVTVEQDRPSARLVQHLRVDPDCGIWFLTSPDSRKALQVQRNGSACYAVEDRDNFAYVSVAGTACLVDEVETRRALWEEGLRAFFPGGPESDGVVAVRIEAERLELMSFAAGVHPEPYGLTARVLHRRDEGWAMTTSAVPAVPAVPAGTAGGEAMVGVPLDRTLEIDL